MLKDLCDYRPKTSDKTLSQRGKRAFRKSCPQKTLLAAEMMGEAMNRIQLLDFTRYGCANSASGSGQAFSLSDSKI